MGHNEPNPHGLLCHSSISFLLGYELKKANLLSSDKKGFIFVTHQF